MPVRQLTDNWSEGTSFGQSVSDKIGFFNVTPIVQRSGASQAAITLIAPATSGYSFTQQQATALLNMAAEVRSSLVAYGLWKGGT